MNVNNFGNREQKIIDNISSSIDEVKVSLGPEIVAYTKSLSATDDSLNYINGASNLAENNFNNLSGDASLANGNSMGQKANVRVRTMDAPNANFNTAPIEKEDANNFYSSSYNNYSEVYNDVSQNRPGSFGTATMLILLFSTLLVALVAAVSIMIFNYVGF